MESATFFSLYQACEFSVAAYLPCRDPNEEANHLLYHKLERFITQLLFLSLVLCSGAWQGLFHPHLAWYSLKQSASYHLMSFLGLPFPPGRSSRNPNFFTCCFITCRGTHKRVKS